MTECEAIDQLEFAGSYRRGRETVGDLDILVDSKQAEQVMDHFAGFSEITSCLLYTSPSPRDRQKSRMPSSA